MSARTPAGRSEERSIPLGIVLTTVGTIILLIVIAVWVVAPGWMPRPLYALIEPYLPYTAVLPTPMPIATIPEIAGNAAVLLPETPLDGEETYPDYFVSAAEATVLDPLAGQPIRIVIPAIDVDAAVVAVSLESVESNGNIVHQWQVPDGYRAGWQDNSARLGKPGNTVLNGHHNIYGEIFRDLDELQEGDEIILYDARKSYTYQVTEKELFLERDQPLSVRLENARWMAPTDDERVTLISCWPYTDNSHRLVIVAHPAATPGS